MYREVFKFIIDILSAFLALILLFPFLLVLALLIAVSNNGTPFFTQHRVGLNQKVFTIVKFKTMNDRRDKLGRLLPDNERLTVVGKIVRNLSIDELPQLLNILAGQMSFIGPRPLPVMYVSRYTPEQLRRHDVRPGISGWAQVNGRNQLSWEEKFNFDIYYVDNMSFFLDLKILIITVKKVFGREGINASENITMTEFKGKKEE